jgi:hypothetical protein
MTEPVILTARIRRDKRNRYRATAREVSDCEVVRQSYRAAMNALISLAEEKLETLAMKGRKLPRGLRHQPKTIVFLAKPLVPSKSLLRRRLKTGEGWSVGVSRSIGVSWARR